MVIIKLLENRGKQNERKSTYWATLHPASSLALLTNSLHHPQPPTRRASVGGGGEGGPPGWLTTCWLGLSLTRGPVCVSLRESSWASAEAQCRLPAAGGTFEPRALVMILSPSPMAGIPPEARGLAVELVPQLTPLIPSAHVCWASPCAGYPSRPWASKTDLGAFILSGNDNYKQTYHKNDPLNIGW